MNCVPMIAAALGRVVKLGAVHPSAERAAKTAERTPKLARFAKLDEAAVPTSVDYSKKARASLDRMYMNNQLGCCVITGKFHTAGVWTGNDDDGNVLLGTDQEIVQEYNRLKAGPGDSGCVVADVLDAFESGGILMGGQKRKIGGYVSIDWSNPKLVKAAFWAFGPLTVVFNVPADWVQNASEGAVWDLTNSGFVGGHDVSMVGYDNDYVYLSTWGVVVKMTWRAFVVRNYLTECYALLSDLWYGKDGVNQATGIDVAGLKKALEDIKNGNIPDPIPVPPPVPVPPPAPPVPQGYTFVGNPVKVPWFGGTITPTGKIVPTAQAKMFMLDRAPVEFSWRSINWFALFRDIPVLINDLKNADLAGAKAVLDKLFKAIKDKDFVTVFALWPDVEKLLTDPTWLVILADAKKVLADFGIVL